MGEWVGRWLDADHGAQAARLRLDAGSADAEHPVGGTLDLPGALRFDLPVRGWWPDPANAPSAGETPVGDAPAGGEAPSGDAPADSGPPSDDRRSDDRLIVEMDGRVGTAVRDGGSLVLSLGDRTTRLYRSAAPDPTEFARWVGAYAGGRRRLILGAVTGDHSLVPFCADDDALVRLYPVTRGDPGPPDAFVSERGEMLVPRDREHGGGRYLLLHRGAGGPRVELARTPSPVEERVTFTASLEDERVELAGTLLHPAGHVPRPVVVLVPGPQGGLAGQRDALRAIAHRFVDRHVAALVFDPQGQGESGGERTPTIFDTAAAADAAIEHLRTRVDIRADRIGLWGCGAAMWALPMVASSRSDVAFLAGAGTPGVPMSGAETHQRVRALREAGLERELVDRAGRAWELIFRIAVAGRAEEGETAELDTLLKELDAEPALRDPDLPEYARAEPMLGPAPPRMAAAELVHRLSGPPDAELGYDPVSDLMSVRCPVLLQYGEHDRLIPVRESTRRLGDALAAAGNTDVTIAVHPEAGELLEASPSDERARDALHAFRFTPGALDELVAWVAARAR